MRRFLLIATFGLLACVRAAHADDVVIATMRAVLESNRTVDLQLRRTMIQIMEEELAPFDDLGKDKRAMAADHLRYYLAHEIYDPAEPPDVADLESDAALQKTAEFDRQRQEVAAKRFRWQIRNYARLMPVDAAAREAARQAVAESLNAIPGCVRRLVDDLPPAQRNQINQKVRERLLHRTQSVGNYFVVDMLYFTRRDPLPDDLASHIIPSEKAKAFQKSLADYVQAVTAPNFSPEARTAALDRIVQRLVFAIEGSIHGYWSSQMFVIDTNPESLNQLGLSPAPADYLSARAALLNGPLDNGQATTQWPQVVDQLLQGTPLTIQDDGRITGQIAFLRQQ
jgi:hypothetical protein